MTVEITSVSLSHGVVSITAVDCSEEHLQYLERRRDDGAEKTLEFVIDTTSRRDYIYFHHWMKQQKATREATTWGEALQALYGTVTSINAKYRVWD